MSKAAFLPQSSQRHGEVEKKKIIKPRRGCEKCPKLCIAGWNPTLH